MTKENIILPYLSCPFPEKISPFADKVHAHTLEWVQNFQLVTEEKAFKRLRLSKFGRLAARAYPDAALDRLEIISDWNTWLFVIDDQCDESGLGKHPDQLSNLHNRSLEILSGYPTEPNDVPLILALEDIYRRLKPLSSQAWLLRFAKSASEYFEATFWEAQNRFYRRWPSTDSYTLMRPFSGGLYTDIDLIEIAEKINIPCIARAHPRLTELANLTNNVVCWSNDIISLRKEQAHGDMHNMVMVMQHELKISLQESVNLVKKLIDAQIQQFLNVEQQLPKFVEFSDHDLKKYVAVLRSWMRGNLDWAYESKRYAIPQKNVQPRVEHECMEIAG
ncbi:MAG: hypothetical protein H6936_12395 [Burkholderiales bacterium]|nr:hypothetical protein [Nitrosomonas sp.]MCP5275620.1 hypothetical protein [Burkholderiales bacterium]